MADVTVPLLDLKPQYRALQAALDAAVLEVAQSQSFILGPKVQAFEESLAGYCGAKRAVGCASGSDALLLSLMALGVGPGDEVLCPSYTFFATGGSIARLGAKAVYADIDPATYNLDLGHARRVAAKCGRLKALMPVHLFGRAADMDGVLALGAELGVPVIEDAAQAVGSRDSTGAACGSRGTLGCFSFFPSKNLGCFGDGGAVVTDDDELADLLSVLRVHGGKPKYHHRVLGVNARLDAMQAAVLSVKLPHLDAWHEGRARNAAFYDAQFRAASAHDASVPLGDNAHRDGIPLRYPQAVGAPGRHIYNQYVVRVPASMRDGLRAHLAERRIGSEVYYPVPLHLQGCFSGLGYAQGDLPHTEAAAAETLALPIYPELTGEQRAHVAETTVSFLMAGAGGAAAG